MEDMGRMVQTYERKSQTGIRTQGLVDGARDEHEAGVRGGGSVGDG